MLKKIEQTVKISIYIRKPLHIPSAEIVINAMEKFVAYCD